MGFRAGFMCCMRNILTTVRCFVEEDILKTLKTSQSLWEDILNTVWCFVGWGKDILTPLTPHAKHCTVYVCGEDILYTKFTVEWSYTQHFEQSGICCMGNILNTVWCFEWIREIILTTHTKHHTVDGDILNSK